jgi:hypothetical protein
MGDAGEGLVDADARIQERLEDLARQRADRRAPDVRDPAALRELESLRLARAELQRQIDTTAHARRRDQLEQARAEIDRRMGVIRAEHDLTSEANGA